MNNNFRKLDSLLRNQSFDDMSSDSEYGLMMTYAGAMAQLENTVVVLSDLKRGESRIFSGGFASVLGIGGYEAEPSIWEKQILNLMSAEEREAKYMAELRFFHYLRGVPRSRRRFFYLASKLRFGNVGNRIPEVLHRMYYVYEADGETVRFALCLYGPLTFDFAGKSVVVNSIDGSMEELTSSVDDRILSRREKQVLGLIDEGLTSAEIAGRLMISRHTVSRHRQEILAKLQVRNSVEACRLAKSLNLIH